MMMVDDDHDNNFKNNVIFIVDTFRANLLSMCYIYSTSNFGIDFLCCCLITFKQAFLHIAVTIGWLFLLDIVR